MNCVSPRMGLKLIIPFDVALLGIEMKFDMNNRIKMHTWMKSTVNTCFCRHTLWRNIGCAAVIRHYTFVSNSQPVDVSMSAKSPTPRSYFHTKPLLSSADKCISTLSQRAIGNYFSILFFTHPGQQQQIASTRASILSLCGEPTCECWEITTTRGCI